MPEKLSNISKKFDEVRKEVLTLINSATIKCSCEFLVVGATARDIILKYCYEITADLRATIDLDVAINVPDWEGFQKIKDVLIETGRFNKDRLEHRIYYEGSSPVDIIPFGGIENTEGKIFFPPENRFEMTTLGFKEALTNARRV
ncbi:MAG: hypothetical protein KAQ90_04095, partial [Melioribacteraceae bacterium]|nr:hypothetical protein [Melioribacteraceae bacterium]